MTDEEIIHNERELSKFFDKEREKNIAFLRKNYSLTKDNAEYVYQDSCLAMFKNIQDGKLVTLTSKLSTYFTQICKFQALKKKRDTKQFEFFEYGQYDSNKVEELMNYGSSPFSLEQMQEMEKFIKSLPKPCNDILWSYYYDNKSFEEIATMTGYKNGSTIKVNKWKCISKLKNAYYTRIIKDIIDEK